MDKPTITFGSLFSGIGGLDLGFERAGFQVKWQVENNDYCTKVLAKHWPDVARHGDVRHVGKHNLKPVDCIVGGFPCQPHSQAGERKASSDERDLWPEFYRIICELKPCWVVAENVLGLLSSENGAFFGGILRDLAEAGYDARWSVLSAAQFGAPHLRERVIVVAHYTGQRSGTWRAESAEQCRATITDRNGTATLAHASSPEWWQSAEGWRNVTDWTNTGWEEAAGGFEFCREELAHTNGQRCDEWRAATRDGDQGQRTRRVSPRRVPGDAQSRLGRATYGISRWLDRYRWPARPGQDQEAWEAPRVVAEKKINRTARLKGLGNAVVVALAESVAREISIRNECEVVA